MRRCYAPGHALSIAAPGRGQRYVFLPASAALRLACLSFLAAGSTDRSPRHKLALRPCARLTILRVAPSYPARPMHATYRNLILLALVVVAVVLATLRLRPRAQSSPQTAGQANSHQSRQAIGRTTVAALGRLEPKGGVIDVGGTAGERIDRLAVAEGDSVKSGQELAFLGSYPLRKRAATGGNPACRGSRPQPGRAGLRRRDRGRSPGRHRAA